MARYGHEEFAAILPETDTAGSAIVAEGFRESIEALQIPHELSQTSDKVTISLGAYTAVPDPSCTAEIHIKEADSALYSAKESSRNKFVHKDIA